MLLYEIFATNTVYQNVSSPPANDFAIYILSFVWQATPIKTQQSSVTMSRAWPHSHQNFQCYGLGSNFFLLTSKRKFHIGVNNICDLLYGVDFICKMLVFGSAIVTKVLLDWFIKQYQEQYIHIYPYTCTVHCWHRHIATAILYIISKDF